MLYFSLAAVSEGDPLMSAPPLNVLILSESSLHAMVTATIINKQLKNRCIIGFALYGLKLVKDVSYIAGTTSSEHPVVDTERLIAIAYSDCRVLCDSNTCIRPCLNGRRIYHRFEIAEVSGSVVIKANEVGTAIIIASVCMN